MAAGRRTSRCVIKNAAKSIKIRARAHGSLTETTAYDGFGRPTSVTLGGIKTTYRYDELGRRTFVSNPASSSGTTFQPKNRS
jgi:YD repeat-containing protein